RVSVRHALGDTAAWAVTSRVEAVSSVPGVVVLRGEGAAPRITAASDEHGEALERALAPLRASDPHVWAGENERTVLWEKVARLAPLAAATTASGLGVGALRDEEPWATR